MAFMTLKTIVFKMEKKTFQLPNFVPFIVCFLPGLVNKTLKMTFFLSRGEGDKRDWYRKI